MDTFDFVDRQLAALDRAIDGLMQLVTDLENRLRRGEKSAYKTAKHHKGELAKLRQQRALMQKKARRLSLSF